MENFDLDDETSLPHISFWLQKYSVLKCSFGKSDTHTSFFMNSSEEVVDVQYQSFSCTLIIPQSKVIKIELKKILIIVLV